MEERFGTSAGLSGGECLFIVGFTGAIVSCGLCAAASITHGTGAEFSSYVRLTAYLGLTLLVWALLRVTLTKEMSETQFVVSEETVVKIRPQRIVTVPLDQVERLRYVRLPLVSSFGLLKSGEGVVRISLRTENLAGLIGALTTGLAARGRASVFSEKEMDDFLLAANRAEESNARMRRILPYLLGIALLVCTVGTMTAIFLWWFPLFLSLLWSVFGLLLFINALRFAERQLAPEQGRLGNARVMSEDSARDARAYFLAGTIVFVVYLVCGIALRSAFSL
jgi:hypothetical protein